MPLVNWRGSKAAMATEGKGNRAEVLAFMQLRSTEPRSAFFILMWATRLSCLSLIQILSAMPRVSASSITSLIISIAWFQARSGGELYNIIKCSQTSSLTVSYYSLKSLS